MTSQELGHFLSLLSRSFASFAVWTQKGRFPPPLCVTSFMIDQLPECRCQCARDRSRDEHLAWGTKAPPEARQPGFEKKTSFYDFFILLVFRFQ